MLSFFEFNYFLNNSMSNTLIKISSVFSCCFISLFWYTIRNNCFDLELRAEVKHFEIRDKAGYQTYFLNAIFKAAKITNFAPCFSETTSSINYKYVEFFKNVSRGIFK